MKEGELERLRMVAKNAKAFGDTYTAATAEKQIGNLQAQKPLLLIGNKQGYSPYSGIVGDLISDNFKVATDVSNSTIGTKELGNADVAEMAGILGYGQADYSNYLRLRDQISEIRQQGQEKLQKSIERTRKKNPFQPAF